VQTLKYVLFIIYLKVKTLQFHCFTLVSMNI